MNVPFPISTFRWLSQCLKWYGSHNAAVPHPTTNPPITTNPHPYPLPPHHPHTHPLPKSTNFDARGCFLVQIQLETPPISSTPLLRRLWFFVWAASPPPLAWFCFLVLWFTTHPSNIAIAHPHYQPPFILKSQSFPSQTLNSNQIMHTPCVLVIVSSF